MNLTKILLSAIVSLSAISLHGESITPSHKENSCQTIYTSTEPMGDCKTLNFAVPQRADRLRLNIKGATAPPSIYEFSVYAD